MKFIVPNFNNVAPVPLTFMKMGENEPCPCGTEITTEEECESAFKQATQLEIYPVRKSLVSGSWTGVPHQCSYQHIFCYAFSSTYVWIPSCWYDGGLVFSPLLKFPALFE